MSWNPDLDVDLTDTEDEEDDFQRDFKGREAMLFVVDANLFENEERFTQALELIRSAFISGLLINDKDLMGIVFANTQLKPDPLEKGCLENILVPDNCAVFLPPRQLTQPIVEHLLQFIETAQRKFGKDYGIASNGGYGSFANMLRLSLNLFDHCGFSLNNAIIVFMTDRETPHTVQSHEYQVALQKARDLEGREVEFHVIPMVDEFDYDVFYKEFLTLARDGELDAFVPTDPQQLRGILADRKLKQDFLKRTLGHFNFSLGANLDISVQYYNYYKRRSYPRKVKVLRKDNSIVVQKNRIMVRKQDPETLEFTEERIVKSSEGWWEINVGNLPIRITPYQVARVRNLHAPGMMLLGFKPKSELSENMYYLPCNFMYPDDQQIVGSKRLFRALWQRCLERDKIAICLFMRKRKSIPRYVVLVPVQKSNKAANDDSFRSLLSGDGFKIVYLPMAKHIRDIDFSAWNSVGNTATPDGVEWFQKIIKKLRIKYQPNLINDPTLEVLQANLLALSLNIRTDNGGLTDMPDASMQDDRIAAFLPKMNEIFGIDAEQAKKRPAKGSANESSAKIAKTSDDDLKNFDFVGQLIKNKALLSCTVAQLRYILDEHFDVKLPKSATKQILIDKINDLSV